METNLDITIKSPQDAKDFLSELYRNSESFHPDDDVFDILWDERDPSKYPTEEELTKLEAIMDDIHDLPNFDACEYLCELIEADVDNENN